MEGAHRPGLPVVGSGRHRPRGTRRQPAVQGVPETEADLLSYIYFDASFTRPLMDLGWQDARREEDAILALLAD